MTIQMKYNVDPGSLKNIHDSSSGKLSPAGMMPMVDQMP
jgi:hypothetical protein